MIFYCVLIILLSVSLLTVRVSDMQSLKYRGWCVFSLMWLHYYEHFKTDVVMWAFILTHLTISLLGFLVISNRIKLA